MSTRRPARHTNFDDAVTKWNLPRSVTFAERVVESLTRCCDAAI